MKWLALFSALLISVPAYAGMFTDNPDQRGEFVVGLSCGQCHDPITAQKLPVVEGHLALSIFADTPINEVFLGYNVHPPTPSTPLPGTVWLMAVPLLWLARKAIK